MHPFGPKAYDFQNFSFVGSLTFLTGHTDIGHRNWLLLWIKVDIRHWICRFVSLAVYIASLAVYIM